MEKLPKPRNRGPPTDRIVFVDLAELALTSDDVIVVLLQVDRVLTLLKKLFYSFSKHEITLRSLRSRDRSSIFSVRSYV